jgi:hypothetical protein
MIITDPLQALLQAGNQPINNFPVSSRYRSVGTSTLETDDGKNISYLLRRFIPPPDSLELIQAYFVKEGDRLDNLAASAIGDPEQFWQIADANVAIAPEELTENPGALVVIAQPAGIRTY